MLTPAGRRAGVPWVGFHTCATPAQNRGRGRWANPTFAERVHLFLSLIAKSALA